MNTSNEAVNKLNDLFKSAKICIDQDCEITLCGNGTNAFEALNALRAVFRILELPEPKYTDEDVERLGYFVE